jgi:hypothetical protein
MTFRLKNFARFGAVAASTLAFPLSALAAGAKPTLTEDTLGTSAVESSTALAGGDVRQTAARLINVALGFLAIIAVIIVLVGGFQYMLSGGDTTKTENARKLIVSGIIGLAIILSAWAITSFVISRLVTATNG